MPRRDHPHYDRAADGDGKYDPDRLQDRDEPQIGHRRVVRDRDSDANGKHRDCDAGETATTMLPSNSHNLNVKSKTSAQRNCDMVSTEIIKGPPRESMSAPCPAAATACVVWAPELSASFNEPACLIEGRDGLT
jgi:hypothetical protein